MDVGCLSLSPKMYSYVRNYVFSLFSPLLFAYYIFNTSLLGLYCMMLSA